jgi:hypothetical protein
VAAGGGNYFDGFGVGTVEEGARRRHLDGGKGRGRSGALVQLQLGTGG